MHFDSNENFSMRGRFQTTPVRFTEADCAGTKFVMITDTIRYEVRDNFSTLYSIDNDAVLVSFEYISYRNTDGIFNNCSAQPADGFPLSVATMPFDYPIEFSLRFEHEIEGKTVLIQLFKSP